MSLYYLYPNKLNKDIYIDLYSVAEIVDMITQALEMARAADEQMSITVNGKKAVVKAIVETRGVDYYPVLKLHVFYSEYEGEWIACGRESMYLEELMFQFYYKTQYLRYDIKKIIEDLNFVYKHHIEPYTPAKSRMYELYVSILEKTQLEGAFVVLRKGEYIRAHVL